MGKVLITGASDGIGRSIAITLYKHGYELLLLARDENRLKEVSALCGNAQYFSVDLNNHDEFINTTNQIISTFEIDILINNAGIWHKLGDVESLSDEQIIEVINTNLTSQILLTKAVLPHIKNRPNSFIVNIISKSGITAQAGQSVYSASKWGMHGFTDVLREDTLDDPITIVGVYQSGTNTKLFEKAGDDFPTETFTNPDDLAEVVAFILKQPSNLKIQEIHIER